MKTFPWITIRPKHVRFSLRIDRRLPRVGLLVGLLVLAIMIINMGVGEYKISPLDVVKTLLGMETGDPQHVLIVRTLRLPRMLLSALVGLALGTSGALLQGLTRNPLADPSIMGINTGAGLVAVVLTILVRDFPARWIPVAAFAGALVAAGLMYVLAWRKGGDSPMRLILIGVGLSAVGSAVTTLVITIGNIYDVQRAMIWLTGSVYGRSWADFWAFAPWVAIAVPLAWFQARQLNSLHLGEDVALGLGVSVGRQRAWILLIAVALAGASVAVAGVISFVGLIAPHVARRLVGTDHTGLVPTAGMLGALLLVAADWIGRTIAAPNEIPCGLVTAVIGVPFFLTMLYQHAKTK
ncbi:FecCD family ABC transporter permease [Herpetosiphon geysericola]|uniref:Iron ABC transporter permease n=1 Tax=Herpetosiphon geysericola TaxID=70996 RepID=A0A0P6Z0P0_9CHLR|nr:iron ABC transporter permease [Herpetosiphon geysericola]KPL90453.1 iron ABC transporter permease [Herpetosiphon geysericola]